MNKKQAFNRFIILLIIVVIAGTLVVKINQINSLTEDKALLDIEQTIMDAVVTCYLMDGVYPATYEEVKEKTGIAVDDKKYTVFYSVFADNIMPDIEVIRSDR